MRCHYDVLGIPMDATIDDIKKSYRKAALQWHPDKHSQDKDEANRRFLEIQDAYETLSNDQERAWYDSHREIIINGGKPGDTDKNSYLFNIYPYFNPSCYRGYDDDEKGFYTVYREMFVKIAEEDRLYYEEKTIIPDFGKSDSDYENVVALFYAFWLSYCCPRSFVWVEQHDVREANDRYIRRIMEKENKKLRDKAKKERNEEIRKIVEHVRRRDKRVEQYKKMLEEKAFVTQQKIKEKKEAERLKRIEQLKNLDYDWSAVDQHLEELEIEEKKKLKKEDVPKKSKLEVNDVEASGDEAENKNKEQELDESDYDDNLYCVACDKSFRSEKAFQNHEKSKKHRENVDALKKHMREENASFNYDSVKLSEEEQEKYKEEFSGQKTKLSKKQKKKKRQQRLENNEINEEENEKGIEYKETQPEPAEELKEIGAEDEKKISDKIDDDDDDHDHDDDDGKKPKKIFKCSICGENFGTRNKLFEHIKKVGHAALKTLEAALPLSHNATKRNKRLNKNNNKFL